MKFLVLVASLFLILSCTFNFDKRERTLKEMAEDQSLLEQKKIISPEEQKIIDEILKMHEKGYNLSIPLD